VLIKVIKFGIPTIDALIGYDVYEGGSQQSDSNQSVCIVGAPGTSKSVLALHLAATRCAANSNIRVLYVSTDWTYEMASQKLKDFKLDAYSERWCDPYTKRKYSQFNYLQMTTKPRDIEMKNLNPEDEEFTKKLIEFISHKAACNEIGFIDLQSATAGDDWNQILRIVSLVPQVNENAELLIIVDAIEGIELLAGPSDQFGQPRSRRQRIAQFARLVGKHHWALIVEDKGALRGVAHYEEGHYDEEFISDIVIRLGIRDGQGYGERYIQIAKCRANVHQLGDHPLLLRDGRRIKDKTKADDPPVPHSYAYAISSIHNMAASLLAGRKGAM
jgi:KaiC/GvpD/RAD55 family RecA-like ATPase